LNVHRTSSKKAKPFFAVKGKRLAKTLPCIHCHQTGDVYSIADGHVEKGQRHHHALHERCAADWYSGKPSPDDLEPQRQESMVN